MIPKVTGPVEPSSGAEDFLKAVPETPDCAAHFEAKLYKINGKFSNNVRYYAYYAFMNCLNYLTPSHFGCIHVSDLLEVAISNYLVGACRISCNEVDLLIIPKGDLEDLVFPTTNYFNESLAYPWSEDKFIQT
ncbi:MAG: hypothetical protein N3E49_09555, partial [Bacteroidia bacterium]|nr:hypothetical protein [Bacteroidia bacterium]